MSFIRGNKPIVINQYIPASATPAAADGLLTIVSDLVIPVKEIDRIEDAVAPTAGAAHTVQATLAGTPNLSGNYRITVYGLAAGASSVQPYSFNVNNNQSGVPLTLNQIRDKFIAAINASSLLLVASIGGAGIVQIAGTVPGQTFRVTVYTDDAGVTFDDGTSVAVTVTGVSAVGQVAYLSSLFPHLTITVAGTLVKLTRTFRLDDGGNKKAVYFLYCEAAADAAAIVAALDITDTSASDQSQAAQTVQVN